MATLRRASTAREPELVITTTESETDIQRKLSPTLIRDKSTDSQGPHLKQNRVRRSTVGQLGRSSHVSRYSFMMLNPDLSKKNQGSSEWDDFGHKKAHVVTMPTYRMHPEKEEAFNWRKANNVLTSVMSGYLANEKYDRYMCSTFVKTLSEMIKDRIKELKFSKRYKYVCHVTLGQKPPRCLPSVVHCSRCLWNPEVDNFVSVTFNKGDIFAVATLYASYLE